MVPIPQFIGVEIKRREDPALITGRGQYVADIQLENMAFVSIVRSPYGHARLLDIDTTRAETQPDVLLVATSDKLNQWVHRPLQFGKNLGHDYVVKREYLRYPLASEIVRYAGDPVAVVVATDPYKAADAANAIQIDYELLPVVMDPEAALEPGAPLVEKSWDSNIAYRWKREGGDCEGAFGQADNVIELRLSNQRLIPNAMEPRAVTALHEQDPDRFTIWSATQIPHMVRTELVEILGVPKERIRVIAPEVGGGFGAKANIYVEEILLPLLARELGRPLRWVATKTEDFVATVHGRGQIDLVRLAADSSGKVTGIDLKIIVDCGAYFDRVTPYVGPLTAMMSTGVYDIPNARTEVIGVMTHKAPTEPYRGAGRPEAAYLIERAMDHLAHELNLDPVEIRRRNFIPPERFPYKTPTRLTYDSGAYKAALDCALQKLDYLAAREEQAWRKLHGKKPLGIGIACYVEICGFGPWEYGSVRIDPEGKALVLTGTSPQGQGHHTTWAQIVAHILQVPLEDVTVKHGDTQVVPRGTGTFGSRSAPVGGSAVYRNAEVVRDRAIKIAAHLLEAAIEDMTLEGGRFFVRGSPMRTITWQQIGEAVHSDRLPSDLAGSLSSDEDFKPEDETYPFGAHICVLEIDPETGQLQILRYVSVDDCGRVINPLIVRGQIHGGAAQGISQALYEGAVYDENGNLLTGSLVNYTVPRADQIPSFESYRTETPSPLNPLGAKGIGEAATIGSTPAVVNAAVDALWHLGVRQLDMPLTPESIWRAIQAGRSAAVDRGDDL